MAEIFRLTITFAVLASIGALIIIKLLIIA